MSALAGSGHQSLKFTPGVTHSGTIVGVREQQARDFNDKRKLKFFPDGNPIMDVVLTLDLGADVRGDLYISGKRMKDAVKAAFREAGLTDISEGDDISVTCTGMDGQAKCYSAVYTTFAPAA